MNKKKTMTELTISQQEQLNTFFTDLENFVKSYSKCIKYYVEGTGGFTNIPKLESSYAIYVGLDTEWTLNTKYFISLVPVAEILTNPNSIKKEIKKRLNAIKEIDEIFNNHKEKK